ncbi:MAG: AEC family transporter [Clostridia bacterium]|nr:AEC family transporter [Clostridia bacterium]
MLDNFVFSINAILPVFIMVALGWVLKNIEFLPESFFDHADKFVFKIALPCNLFVSVLKGDVSKLKNALPLMGFIVVGISVFFVLACAVVPLIIKDNGKRGAFIQGIYRGNFAILGLPIAGNLFPENDIGATTVAVVMPLAIVAVNVFAVIILTVYAPSDVKKKPLETAANICLSIVKNPLIISCLLGLVFMLCGISLPTFAQKTVDGLSDTVFALALMSLGAEFYFSALKGKVGTSLVGAIIKTAVLPLIAVSVAVLMGFRNVELGVILIFFGAPTAVSSYIMAKNMKSDHEMASQILLISTLLCMITLFIGIFILKTFKLI